MTDRQQLEHLIVSRHPCIAINTFEEDYVLRLVRQIAVERGIEFYEWSVKIGRAHV